MINKTALIEGLKELGRVALLAIIPVVIDQLTAGAINFRLIGIIAAIAILRAVDKFLHEKGMLEDNATLVKGITQF